MADTASLLRQHTPTSRELDDLELMRLGALGVAPRFGPPESGITLVVPPETLKDAPRALELTDPEGAPLAVVEVSSTYEHEDQVGIVGDVRHTGRPATRPFEDLYLDVTKAKDLFTPVSVAVPVDKPISQTDISRIAAAANEGRILFVAMVSHSQPRALAPAPLIRATRSVAATIENAAVIAVPFSRHDGAKVDAKLTARILTAYAHDAHIVVPTGEGPLPPSVQQVVDAENPQGPDRGAVVFFTGLSGSGKSTLAHALINRTVETGERRVTSLDGDVVRRNLSKGLTFSVEDRETNVRRIGWVASEIARHGGMVVCSPIAPFDSTRREVRRMVDAAKATFVLVHVATPLEECERRDRKGLYARARRGEIPHFTGISSPYEVPEDAEVVVDTTLKDTETALAPILEALKHRGVLTFAANCD